MANVIYKRGLSADLPENVTDGEILVTTDTGEMYVAVGSKKVKISDQKKLELWKPNTRYEPGDMVIVNAELESLRTAIFTCIGEEGHISSTQFSVDFQNDHHWEFIVELEATKAACDGEGSPIHSTYEKISNKVNIISDDEPSESEYPSAKAIYGLKQNLNGEFGAVYDQLSTLSQNKQDKLIAGDNIIIEDNIISAIGGSSDEGISAIIEDETLVL